MVGELTEYLVDITHAANDSILIKHGLISYNDSALCFNSFDFFEVFEYYFEYAVVLAVGYQLIALCELNAININFNGVGLECKTGFLYIVECEEVVVIFVIVFSNFCFKLEVDKVADVVVSRVVPNDLIFASIGVVLIVYLLGCGGFAVLRICFSVAY